MRRIARFAVVLVAPAVVSAVICAGGEATLGKLTPAQASAAFDAYFIPAGAFVSKALGRSCPAVEYNPGPLLPDGYACTTEYRLHGKWHFVSAGIARRNGTIKPVGTPYRRSWTRTWRPSSLACRRTSRLQGFLSSNDAQCDALMASDIEYDLRAGRLVHAIGYHGTNWAGFEAIASFNCTREGHYGYRCQNRLGDPFRYSPVLPPRPGDTECPSGEALNVLTRRCVDYP
jgi:hypothetical protein